MGASSMYRRPLSRDSAHRQALLKNLVTSLIKQEQISTTYAKAKETQRMVEKLITLGKKNTVASRNSAKGFFHEPELYIEKVFGKLAERYKERPGGYTRILQSEPLKDDQARSAILCLIDGPKDMRFNMTARTLLRQQEEGLPMNEVTAMNIRKVTRFRKDGVEALTDAVKNLRAEKSERAEKEKEEAEQGVRYKFTTELKLADPRWREKRGPGRLVKLKYWPRTGAAEKAL